MLSEEKIKEIFAEHSSFVRFARAIEAAVLAEQAKVEPDCNTCANRGRVNGLSQETYCEQCSRQAYRVDHYKAAEKAAGK